MTFIERLFGIGKKNQEPERNDAEDFPEISEDLFVSKERPEPAEPVNRSAGQGALTTLLNRDYDSMGYRDGYEIQDLEICEARVKAIASEFRAAYREAIHEIEKDILGITPHLNDKVKECMPLKHRRLRDRHAHLLTLQASLLGEVDLSRKCEGICETSLADYRLAFQRGLSDHLDDEIVFNQ